nr:hypothetical protein BaRGS_006020 [Batillaria attramentaria]
MRACVYILNIPANVVPPLKRDEWFLTPRNLKVIYGKSSVDGVLSNAHSISQIIPYHGFNKKLLHDIALLKLEEPITANETVGVVCLPCPAEQPLAAGDEGVVTGWGSDLSELREVQLSVAEDKECKKHFTDLGYDDGLVTSDTFCSVSNTTTDDASDGDSGGPFVVQGRARWR